MWLAFRHTGRAVHETICIVKIAKLLSAFRNLVFFLRAYQEHLKNGVPWAWMLLVMVIMLLVLGVVLLVQALRAKPKEAAVVSSGDPIPVPVPATPLPPPPPAPEGEDFRRFVGPKADYYIRHKDGFNWFAFFLPFAWLLLRKMYLYAALVMLGFFFLMTVLESLFGSELVVLSGLLIVSIVIGSYANQLYRHFVFRRLRQLKAKHDAQHFDEQCIRAGGVNLTLAVLVLLVQAGAVAVEVLARFEDRERIERQVRLVEEPIFELLQSVTVEVQYQDSVAARAGPDTRQILRSLYSHPGVVLGGDKDHYMVLTTLDAVGFESIRQQANAGTLNAYALTVTLADRTTATLEKVLVNSQLKDMVVIVIRKMGADHAVLPLGDMAMVRGYRAFSLRSPAFAPGRLPAEKARESLTNGIVIGHRELASEKGAHYRVFETRELNGGPVVDALGGLVGFNIGAKGNSEGYYFAIESSEIKRAFDAGEFVDLPLSVEPLREFLKQMK